MFFKIVAGYFLLSRGTSRLSRETSVALQFFCSLHCRSLCLVLRSACRRFHQKNYAPGRSTEYLFFLTLFPPYCQWTSWAEKAVEKKRCLSFGAQTILPRFHVYVRQPDSRDIQEVSHDIKEVSHDIKEVSHDIQEVSRDIQEVSRDKPKKSHLSLEK